MKYLNIMWIIFGSVLLNTWRDIVLFYWYRCTYIGSKNNKSIGSP